MSGPSLQPTGGDEALELADPADWPMMPLHPKPIASRPPIGSWVWLITETVRHSSFHEVATITAVDDDDERLVIVTVACHRSWPLEYFAAVVAGDDPVLGRARDGTHAACRNCEAGGRGRRTYWDRLLERDLPDQPGA